jgi:adenylate cyclase
MGAASKIRGRLAALRRASSNKRLRQLLIGAGLAALVLVAQERGLLETLEYKTLDLRFQIRGPIEHKLPIVIVNIDQDSFDELDLPWPWPRTLHAELIRKLKAAGAKVIAFDVLFTEPKPDPREDQTLADAIREAGNVVLAAEQTEVDSSFGQRSRLSLPIPLIRQHAMGYGPANLIIEKDGVVRSGRFGIPFQDRIFPGFAYRIYEAATGRKPSNGEGLSLAAYYINYRGPNRSYPIAPYYRVLRDEINPEFFRDKIVLIGAYSPSLHDFFGTPFSASEPMAGVEVQANFVDTMAGGDPVVPVPGWILVTLFIVFVAISVWASINLKPLQATTAVIVAMAVYAFLGLYHFWSNDLWLGVAPVVLACTLSYGGIILDHYIAEQRERLRTRAMLNRYLSPKAAAEVMNAPEGVELQGSRMHITVLFSDVRGFTALSEHLKPEEVVSLLSDYLGRAAHIVFNNDGFLDKFIGDAVFAIFGWPPSLSNANDAVRAIKTGIEMIELVDSLADKWTQIIGRPLKVGIGINTGDAVLGNIGSESKSDLTAIGDTVNLGARLEALTKELGVPMLVSEYTAAEVNGAIPLRPLRRVKVQGREAPLLVYCPEVLIKGEIASAADAETPYVQQHK